MPCGGVRPAHDSHCEGPQPRSNLIRKSGIASGLRALRALQVCPGNKLVGRVANPSYISIRRGAARGMENCLETLKTRCFTNDLPQRTLNGRPVHGKAVTIARVPCWGHMLPRGMGNSQ